MAPSAGNPKQPYDGHFRPYSPQPGYKIMNGRMVYSNHVSDLSQDGDDVNEAIDHASDQAFNSQGSTVVQGYPSSSTVGYGSPESYYNQQPQPSQGPFTFGHLHPDRGSHRKFSEHAQAVDEVPPPRKLPFASASTNTIMTAAQLLPQARASPAQLPTLANGDSTTTVQEVSSLQRVNNDAGKGAEKKRPASRQGPLASNGSRSRRKLESTQGVASIYTNDLRVSEESSGRAIPSQPGVLTRSATARMNKGQTTENQQQAGVVAIDSVVQHANAKAPTGELVGNGCIRCRNRRWQCDLLKPACGSCKLDGRKCTYANLSDDGEHILSDKGMGRLATVGGQMPATAPVTRDAATQVSGRMQDVAVQADGADETPDEVRMEDAATNTTSTYADALVSTANSDDIWLPFSQAVQLVLWAKDRREEQRKIIGEVLRTTDLSKMDYEDKISLAKQYDTAFESALRERCEEVVRLSS